MHQAVALRGERVFIGHKRPVISPAQLLRVLTPEPQGSLALIRPFLLFHFQYGEIGSGPVSTQPDLPAQLQAVDFVVKVLVIRRVEIEGADHIALGAVVNVGVHNGPQAASQDRAVGDIDGKFLLLPQDLVHRIGTSMAPKYF